MFQEVPRADQEGRRVRGRSPALVLVSSGFVKGRPGLGKEDPLQNRLERRSLSTAHQDPISLGEILKRIGDGVESITFRNDHFHRAVIGRIRDRGIDIPVKELASFAMRVGDLVVVLSDDRTTEFSLDAPLPTLRIVELKERSARKGEE